MLHDFLVAKEIGSTSHGQYQEIVLKFADTGQNGLGSRSDFQHFTHPDPDILSFLKNLPQGKGDAGGFNLRSGHLVKQGLKLMMVLFVNQNDIKHPFLEMQNKLQAGETSAGHDDHWLIHFEFFYKTITLKP